MLSYQSYNDREQITAKKSEEITKELCVYYSLLHRSFLKKYAEIQQSYEQRDISEVINLYLKVFGIPQGFCTRVGYSSTKISQKGFAAMSLKFFLGTEKPVSGDIIFSVAKADLFQYSSCFIQNVIAHEISHARLFLDGHRLRQSEFATDVLALLVTGCRDLHQQRSPVGYYIRPDLRATICRTIERHLDIIYL